MHRFPSIPFDAWTPLATDELAAAFEGARFFWCLAGGHALERFVGTPIRHHGDIDVSVLRRDQLALRAHLVDWDLYAADPPGQLRFWPVGEQLPDTVHDVWGVRRGHVEWELQIMLQEAEAQHWVYRREPAIRGPLDELATMLDGIPCLRPEIQLLYKSKDIRPKDQVDFERCFPALGSAAKSKLAGWLARAYPAGHAWIVE
ncbi:MAG: amino acid transporter [bacterium]|nr:amino acid transporter [bacterium]